MGLFGNLFGNNKASQQSREIARVSELLQNKDYRTLGTIISNPIQIQASQQEQGAQLYLQALKTYDHLEASKMFNRTDGPLSGLLGNSYSQEEMKNVANIIVWLLNSGLDPNTTIQQEPLAHAVIENANGSYSIELGLEALIRAGLDVNTTSVSGKTVLGSLLTRGMMPFRYTADSFVNSGAVLNQSDLADHKVYETVFQNGLYRIAKIIPTASLSQHVNVPGKNSLTLLHLTSGGLGLDVMRGDTQMFDEMYASNGRYPELAEMLLVAGADIAATTNTGHDAMSIAVSFNHMDTAKILDAWAANHGGSTLSEAINTPIDSKATHLFLSSFDGNTREVMELLDQGADPNIRSYINYNFLAEDTMLPSGMPTKVASLFFEQSMMRQRHPDKFFDMSLGLTNLHYPCLEGYADVVHLLLEAGEDPSARSFHGIFPLYVAAEMGHLEIVRDLVEHGAEIDQTTPNNCTALLNAAEEGHADVVSYLLSRGADPSIANKFGATPLDGALRYGHQDVANILERI